MAPYVLRKLRDANYRILRPVRPNAGVEAAYRRKLLDLVDAMGTSVRFWLLAARKANEPRMAVIAMDSPASELRDAMAKLARQWLYRFDEAADMLAEYFATDVADRSDTALWSALRHAGIAIGKFKMTRTMRDVLDATIHENVALIKSIPRKYLPEVEGMVMRSVQRGGDLKTLTDDLQKHFGVTRNRAALIARDQNNKATSAMQRARQIELDITQAIWLHSHAGKKPRPTHVKMDGKVYDVKTGMWDSHEGRYVFPGELINCRCVSRSVIPGLGL